MVRSPLAYTVKTPVAVSGIRPTATTGQKAPTTTVVKTITATAQGKTVNVATTLNKAVVPSSLPKPATKEKEKKTFSSAGYTLVEFDYYFLYCQRVRCSGNLTFI